MLIQLFAEILRQFAQRFRRTVIYRRDDIERAKPCNDAAHGWMQHEGSKAGIVAQEKVAIPQAKPREKEQNDSHLE